MAVGIADEVVLTLRRHAILGSIDAAATVSAPSGWHRLVVTARGSGHIVLSVRYSPLGRSRWNNVSAALAARGWQLDDDGDGATCRYPPGSETSEASFEILAALTSSGAPADVREVTAVDGNGLAIDLHAQT